MAVKRISDIDIKNNNSLFTAIYGNITDSEFFIDSDLKKYNLWQQLHLYLKSEGYTVLFYDSNNVHSYSQADLIEFLDLKYAKENVQPNKYVGKLKSPFKQTRLNNAEKNAEKNISGNPLHQSIQLVSETGYDRDKFYRTSKDTGELDCLKKLFAHNSNKPNKKVAFIIKNPESHTFPKGDKDTYTDFFSELKNNYVKNKSSDKIFVIYNYKDKQSLISSFDDPMKQQFFFFSNDFKQQFVGKEKLKDNTFFIDLPEQNEIRNLLNRERLTNNLLLFSSVPFDKILLRLRQERKTNKDILALNLQDYITKIDTTNTWDKLKSLKGIDSIIEQLQRRITSIKRNKNLKTPAKDRPHLAFKGNPGTGKTTVAKLFAEILREEGILEIGHCVEVKVSDLIAEHFGGTRIKAQQKCDEAKGGVLFIDEAYGLLDGNDNQNGFGKEAIEILIQFMENNTDSMVIIAGYTDDINKLIKEGNQGFARRFVSSNHIVFNDYSPEVLIQIAENQLKDYQVADAAKKMIGDILRTKHNLRNANWGNAGEVENLLQEIRDEFYNTTDTEIDTKHIPMLHKNRVKPKKSDEYSGLKKLNSLIGLSQMKNSLENILKTIKADKIREEKLGLINTNYKLNFVFRGNPGTGKTTVARLLGEILCEYGLLSDTEVVECRKEDITGKFLGETEQKVKELFSNAVGKVLFFDEIYSLVDNYGSGGGYGADAINTIVGLMTDQRYSGKMAFVIAGYPDETNNFITRNPGLTRRFNFYVDFDDYSNEDLLQIYLKMILDNNLHIAEGCEKKALQWFSQQSRGKDFKNAGFAEELLGITKGSLDQRIADCEDIENIQAETLITITEFDFPN
ncbi:hypothetical protein AGMMS50239_04100 [Bacteroidia bacterium]|nr:hypothetical protein AGMMS50239_04100 [Bacteroidia bacterium]